MLGYRGDTPGEDFTQTNSLVNCYRFSYEGFPLVPRRGSFVLEVFVTSGTTEKERSEVEQVETGEGRETTRQLEGLRAQGSIKL